MRFLFYSPVAFEKWDWRSSVEKGIGGAETSHVEMAWRLARRGHEVITYAPIPDDCPGEWRGTRWHRLEDVDWSQEGVWILYRCPERVDEFPDLHPGQSLWLMMQDWDYPSWTAERVAKLDRIIPLCHAHERWLLNRHPEFKGKTWVTRNAIKGDLIEEVEAAGVPQRNPLRIMYASSPDRGLLAALKIFRRAKEFVPDLELHATYGFNNIDKLIAGGNRGMAKLKDECMKLVEQTGAIFHGRLTQQQLYREWLKTGINVYCTDFWETGYITGLEGSALGAIPIFSPIWAQGENLRHGFPIQGPPHDPMTLARFAATVVQLATDPGLQDAIRQRMMPAVRAAWDWEQFVHRKPGENWEQAAAEDIKESSLALQTA